MNEKIETLIIGAGQAGLSLGHFLSQAGHDYIILEKAAQVADAWRNRRPDSFTLVTPNWTFQLPGGEYADAEPDGFMPKDEIVHRFEQYEQNHRFPIRYSSEVKQVKPMQGHYRYQISTLNETYEAKNVVLATGMYQKVKVPPYADKIPQDILQITSDAYRNPQTLPPGAVLVVGARQSGCQIAEELRQAGRRVYHSTGSAGWLPRRYRGKDGVYWLNQIGFLDRTPDMLNSPKERLVPTPQLTGKDGGHDINLHIFFRKGIILMGHVRGYEQGKLFFDPDLKENLRKGDEFCTTKIELIDAYIAKNGFNAPAEELKVPQDGYQAPIIESLDLKKEGICTIIWATGYSMDFSMVEMDLLDSDGYPSADRGVSNHRGLYFLGMNWMNKMKSGILMGIAESARHLAEKISA